MITIVHTSVTTNRIKSHTPTSPGLLAVVPKVESLIPCVV